MSRDSGTVRNFSLLSINHRTSPKPSKSTDDLRNSPSPRPRRPTSSAREGSSNPRRLSILGLRAQRSMHDLGATLKDTSSKPHARLSSLNLGQPYLQNHEPSPPLPSNPRVATPSYHQSYEQSPNLLPSAGPRSSRMLDSELMPPPPIGGSFAERTASPSHSRASSRTRGRPESFSAGSPDSRANSPARDLQRPLTPTGKLGKKKTWLPGKSHGRNDSASNGPQPWAFIVGTAGKQSYELSYLTKAQPVAELWNEQGDLLVHLFDRNGGPSFKVDSTVIVASRRLVNILHGGTLSRNSSLASDAPHAPSRSLSLNSNGSPPIGPVGEDGKTHLYMPLGLSLAPGSELKPEDLENLVAVRNLFAFLVGQVLVGTPKQPTLFAVFNNIAGLLAHYDFTNMDGSSLGEVASANFLGYIEDLRLNDIRHSREKTLEAIILGERMKSWPLYNEGYVHGVGKWEDVMQMDSPIFSYISGITRKRMEKSHMDLYNRLKNTRARLDDFDFPSLFTGVAASSSFGKVVDIKTWKNSWQMMRRFTVSFYKRRYGGWPPKARSKKNDFEESGLNRIVLQELYRDFSDLYDMLVDKSSLTTRKADPGAHDEKLADEPTMHNLRTLMSEFDRSTPPVRPPIPYDLCLRPDLGKVRRDFDSLPEKKKAKERGKKLKDDEINLALMQSYDRDGVKVTPFLEAFMAFERSMYRGKSIDEIVDYRIGQWIFLYVVMQCLPLLVVDALGVRWTQSVEYFLCEVPRGNPPWIKEERGQKAFYRVAGGAGVVSLPADSVEHSVEAVYHRSHCWKMAQIWSGEEEAFQPASARPPGPSRTASSTSFSEALPTPPPIGQDSFLPPPMGSPRQSHRSSVALGLEALPLPPTVLADEFPQQGRKVSTPDPTRSFDNILGPATPMGKKKGWGSLGG